MGVVMPCHQKQLSLWILGLLLTWYVFVNQLMKMLAMSNKMLNSFSLHHVLLLEQQYIMLRTVRKTLGPRHLHPEDGIILLTEVHVEFSSGAVPLQHSCLMARSRGLSCSKRCYSQQRQLFYCMPATLCQQQGSLCFFSNNRLAILAGCGQQAAVGQAMPNSRHW
jgi:hypothetical protein